MDPTSFSIPSTSNHNFLAITIGTAAVTIIIIGIANCIFSKVKNPHHTASTPPTAVKPVLLPKPKIAEFQQEFPSKTDNNFQKPLENKNKIKKQPSVSLDIESPPPNSPTPTQSELPQMPKMPKMPQFPKQEEILETYRKLPISEKLSKVDYLLNNETGIRLVQSLGFIFESIVQIEDQHKYKDYLSKFKQTTKGLESLLTSISRFAISLLDENQQKIKADTIELINNLETKIKINNCELQECKSGLEKILNGFSATHAHIYHYYDKIHSILDWLIEKESQASTQQNPSTYQIVRCAIL